jgi:hypothetical protein
VVDAARLRDVGQDEVMDPDVDPEDLDADEPSDEDEDEAAGVADVALTPEADVPLEATDADWLDQQREAPLDEDGEDLRP